MIECVLWSVHSGLFENLFNEIQRILLEEGNLRRTNDKSSFALIADFGHTVILNNDRCTSSHLAEGQLTTSLVITLMYFCKSSSFS